MHLIYDNAAIAQNKERAAMFGQTKRPKKKHYETQPQDNEHKCNEAKMCLLHPLFLTIEGWIKEIYIFQLKMFGSAHGVFPF